MSENVADGTVETPIEDINWEERAKKAEAKIVELKKSSKEEAPKEEPKQETPKETTGLDDTQVQKILAREKFLESNPELADHRERFVQLTFSGLSEAGAKAAILAENPEIANRQKTNSLGITGETPPSDKNTYTKEEIIQIAGTDQRLYNEIMDRKAKGEVVVK